MYRPRQMRRPLHKGTFHGAAFFQLLFPVVKNVDEFRLTAVDEENRHTGLRHLVLGKTQRAGSGLGRAPRDRDGVMPGFVFIAYAQKILGQQLYSRLDEGPGRGAVLLFELDLAHEQAGARRFVGRGDVRVLLRQEAGTGDGTPQSHVEQGLGVLLGG